MIQEFYRDDLAYEHWLKNIGGYVYNDFGGSNVDYKKLHKSDCRMLHNVRSGQRKTSYRKICSPDLSELRMKILMMIDCRWSNEEWDFVGIEEWPTIEALEKRGKFEKEELEVYRYVESKTYLGTRESFAEYGKG